MNKDIKYYTYYNHHLLFGIKISRQTFAKRCKELKINGLLIGSSRAIFYTAEEVEKVIFYKRKPKDERKSKDESKSKS